jgi:hypothetical protein
VTKKAMNGRTKQQLEEALENAAWKLALAAVVLLDRGSSIWPMLAREAQLAFEVIGQPDLLFCSRLALDMFPRSDIAVPR